MYMSKYAPPPVRQKEVVKNYGADILELAKLLENGGL